MWVFVVVCICSNFKTTKNAQIWSVIYPHRCVCGLLAPKSSRAYRRTSSSRRWCNFLAIIHNCTQTLSEINWTLLKSTASGIKENERQKKRQANLFLRRVNPLLKSYVHSHTSDSIRGLGLWQPAGIHYLVPLHAHAAEGMRRANQYSQYLLLLISVACVSAAICNRSPGL